MPGVDDTDLQLAEVPSVAVVLEAKLRERWMTLYETNGENVGPQRVEKQKKGWSV